MQMQLSSDVRIPDGLLAANALLAENSHQGFGASTHTLYQGFGVAISSTALGISGTLYDGRVRCRYTGKEHDAETGNDYFAARYFNSATGRWMSPDWADKPEDVPYASLDNPQSLNLYGYVLNNPLSHTDADGHCCEPAWNAFAGFVGGVLNIVPQSINLINSGGNAVLSLTPTSYRIPMLDEIQPDAHASAGGMAVGQAAQVLVPVGDFSEGAQITRNALKGAESEKAGLAGEGLAKNTEKMMAVDPKTGQMGGTIPDAMRPPGATVDVKDVQKLSDSPQLRRQSAISAQNGQKAEIISMNPKAKISSTVKERMNVKTPNQ